MGGLENDGGPGGGGGIKRLQRSQLQRGSVFTDRYPLPPFPAFSVQSRLILYRLGYASRIRRG